MRFRSALAGAAIAAVALTTGFAGRAAAQEQGGTPPSWDTLVRCAKMANDSASLACFRAAMRASGYGPKPEEVAAERKRVFGLPIPEIRLQRREAEQKGESAGAQAARSAGTQVASTSASVATPAPPPPVDENQVSVVLSEVALIQPLNRLLMTTTDGAVWAQTDNAPVTRMPRAGDTVRIERGVIGGYLCAINKWSKVRCERRH